MASRSSCPVYPRHMSSMTKCEKAMTVVQLRVGCEEAKVALATRAGSSGVCLVTPLQYPCNPGPFRVRIG